MTARLKTVLILLGATAALLLVSQFGMGLLIVQGNSGQPLPYGIPVAKLIKAHHHSGYATVSVALIYVVVSLIGIIRTAPSKIQ